MVSDAFDWNSRTRGVALLGPRPPQPLTVRAAPHLRVPVPSASSRWRGRLPGRPSRPLAACVAELPVRVSAPASRGG